ncbi:cell adhesion molecule 3-like [Pecten maximus]|uniref:cell adhesion molecule 3-like n=1 Tax=Pecten maximus TaxID=6579 RepID=UPI00145895FD|nr:cell adhesion molecule 3-like [Pecten maximus]
MTTVWVVSVILVILYSAEVHGDISVTSTVNPVGLIGNNDVELVCTYSLSSFYDRVTTMVWCRETSKDSGRYEELATFYPPGKSQDRATLKNLSNPSVFERIVLTNPTESSLTAKMKFTSVVCGDERKYQCAVLAKKAYTNSSMWAKPTIDTILRVTATPNTTSFGEVEMVPASNIEEGQTVQFTCTSNVGRRAGTFLWTKYRSISDSMGSTVTSTTQTFPSTDCTYTGSSVISIVMTKDDDGVIIRCTIQQETISDQSNKAYYRQTNPIRVCATPNTTSFGEVEMVPASNIEEGQTVQFTCTSNVGRPAGTFLWTKYRGISDSVGTTVTSTTQTFPSTDCTYTGSSVISIVMTKDDDGVIIRCTIQQETISDQSNKAYYRQTNPIKVDSPDPSMGETTYGGEVISTVGMILLSISVILLSLTVGLGIFISHNKRLPFSQTPITEISARFPMALPSGFVNHHKYRNPRRRLKA